MRYKYQPVTLQFLVRNLGHSHLELALRAGLQMGTDGSHLTACEGSWCSVGLLIYYILHCLEINDLPQNIHNGKFC